MDILWDLGVFLKSKLWIVNCFIVGGDIGIRVTSHHSLTYMGRNSTYMSHSILQQAFSQSSRSKKYKTKQGYPTDEAQTELNSCHKYENFPTNICTWLASGALSCNFLSSAPEINFSSADITGYSCTGRKLPPPAITVVYIRVRCS